MNFTKNVLKPLELNKFLENVKQKKWKTVARGVACGSLSLPVSIIYGKDTISLHAVDIYYCLETCRNLFEHENVEHIILMYPLAIQDNTNTSNPGLVIISAGKEEVCGVIVGIQLLQDRPPRVNDIKKEFKSYDDVVSFINPGI